MRLSFGIWVAALLVGALPAFAGNLALESGRNVWISSCTKPTAPPSFLQAHPETAGHDMNTLSGQRNAYVDAMQAYMNCISNDAHQDQALISQTITSSAQKAIADAMAEVNSYSPQVSRKNWR